MMQLHLHDLYGTHSRSVTNYTAEQLPITNDLAYDVVQAFGRLLDLLAERGVLSGPDIQRVVLGYVDGYAALKEE